MEHNFSPKKKYYHKNKIFFVEAGWYYPSVGCAPGGARILKTASPPSSDCSDKESPSDKSNKSKKKIRVENDTSLLSSPPSVSTNKSNKRANEIALNEEKEKVRVEDENNVLNRLIRELSTDSIRTYELYLIIINAEKRKENPHSILESYYFLGEELE